jgi:hypothetical protein
VEKQGTKWDLYAGTNSGVYHREEGGNWEALGDVADPGAETIEGTTVVTLCCASEDRLLAGTAQRGLWRRNTQWTRLSNGLPRIGRLIDATTPTHTCDWSAKFANDLPESGVGTYVLHVSNGDCSSLSFKVEKGNVDLALYYVSPYTSAGDELWAGLQNRQLTKSMVRSSPFSIPEENWTMEEEVQRGFYLLTVGADGQSTSYSIAVQLA